MVPVARLLPAIAVFTFMALAALASQAQQVDEIRQKLDGWAQSLGKVDQELTDATITRDYAAKTRSRLTTLLDEATQAEQQLKSLLDPLRTQFEAMGPPPKEGEPPETGSAARERDRLNERLGDLEGLLRRTEATQARAQNLLRLLSVESSASVAAELLKRGPSPLSLAIWQEGLRDATRITTDMLAKLTAWWEAARPAQVGWRPYATAFLGLMIALAIGAFIRHRLKSRYGQHAYVEQPSYPRAVAGAAVVGLTDSLIPAASAYVLLLLLRETGLVPGEADALARGIVVVIMFYSIVGQLARAALAPQKPQWAIVPLDAERTRKAGFHIKLLVAWLSLGTGVWIASEPYRPASPETTMLFALLANGMTALLVTPFLRRWLWHPPEQADRENKADEQDGQSKDPGDSQRGAGWLTLLRLLFSLAVAAIPISALLGYANLSFQVAGGVVLSAIVIGGLLLSRTMLNAFINALFAPTGEGGWLSRQLEINEGVSQSISFWFGLLIDLGLLLISLPLLMLAWGVPTTVIAYGITEFLQGFTVGGITFKPLAFLWAVVIFAVAMVVFRFLRRTLNQRVLSRTRLDVGARHSISAALGYVGFFIALMLAIATMGLDLSNIAIIAGALSVGIGFGLQNVVNNFVSGLLLLIERPIKVGDWIVVSGYEGTVKRISVRSTEIETFDRAEVVVPNSELVSAPVVNWTHKTRLVRVKIPVGIAYGSDTRLAEKLLLGCAKEHKDVLSYPAPFVLFKAFGESSLDFELRVYARDTDYFMTVTSDLHFAIDKAFRENNIEIPFPQRDLHLKDGGKAVEILRNGSKGESEIPPQGSADD